MIPTGTWLDASGDSHDLYDEPTCGDFPNCHTEPPTCGHTTTEGATTMHNPITAWIRRQYAHQDAMITRALQGREVRRNLPVTDVIAADRLRDAGHQVDADLRNGRDPVDTLFGLMDEFRGLGQDDVSEGLGTLACDIMLAHVTGSSISASLHRMADDLGVPVA